ncbi:MAG: response regulator transcription factor [Promethearchaeia archaeon]
MNKIEHSDVKTKTQQIENGQFSKSIMLIEDDTELLNLYKKILDLGEFRVTAIAKNGEEALEKYQEMIEKPSIIIIDHKMPVKDGLETLIELRDRGYKDKIIYISADYKTKKDAMQKGANAFLEKPFSIKTLMSQIQAN